MPVRLSPVLVHGGSPDGGFMNGICMTQSQKKTLMMID